MKWSDRWEIRTYLHGNPEPRVTGLTALLGKLDMPLDKPAAETWQVQAILAAVRQGFKADRVEAYFDGMALLADGELTGPARTMIAERTPAVTAVDLGGKGL